MSQKKLYAYAVVRFEDETVSEIPSTWLTDDNKYCYWPNSKNVSIFINKSLEPDHNLWLKYPVEVEIFCGKFLYILISSLL